MARASSQPASDPSLSALEKQVAALKKEVASLKKQLASVKSKGSDSRVSKLIEALRNESPRFQKCIDNAGL